MMNVKGFYESHQRFPYSQEFHIIRDTTQGRDRNSGLTAEQSKKPIERFVYAAKLNLLDDLKVLLPLVNIDDYNSAGLTALCAAAQWNNIQCVEFLLDNGASVDQRSLASRSPLLYAAESGHIHMMAYLINRGSTNFTYSDQQLESYYISYAIRQAITRRDVTAVLRDDRLTDLVLDFLGLSATRTRTLDRMNASIDPAFVKGYDKNHFKHVVSLDELDIPKPGNTADPDVERENTNEFNGKESNQEMQQ